MKRLAVKAKVALPKGASNFAMMKVMLEQLASHLSDAERLQILHKRVAPPEQRLDASFFEEEAVQACVPDTELVHLEAHAEKLETAETKDFTTELKTYTRSFCTARAKAKPRAKAKARAKAKGAPSRPPAYAASDISQEEAEAWMPPLCRLYKCHYNNRWLAEMLPWGRLSRSWPRVGETEALGKVLKWAWEKHTEVHTLAELSG